MFRSTIKMFTRLVLYLAMVTTISCANLQTHSYINKKSICPDSILAEKIEYYRQLYPEITFMNLQNEDELPGLDVILGDQPESLDYEHPVDLREDLMLVSIERIWIMLRFKQPSASAFKTDFPHGEEENICVLTINPNELAADSLSATRHLLNLSEKVIQKIAHDMQLPADDYLAFVINHEIYHCLKSIYLGPQLMSHKELWAGYNQFNNELAADALAMHIKTNDKDSPFAKNILRIRGMSIYNADPDHLTCKALAQVLTIQEENIREMTSHQVFELANHIKDRLSLSYDEYLQYLASFIQAMKELGIDSNLSEGFLCKLKDSKADLEQVKALVANARRCFSGLCGGEFEQGGCK